MCEHWACLFAPAPVVVASMHDSSNEEYLGSRILSEVHDLPNQRVIKMDAMRVCRRRFRGLASTDGRRHCVRVPGVLLNDP